MPMVTRCPSCKTLFRVTPEQLQARHGQVRCGRCTTVFDGFRELATPPDRTLPESQQPAAHNAEPDAGSAAPQTATAPVPEPPVPAEPASAEEASAPAGFAFDPVAPRQVAPIPVMPPTRAATPAFGSRPAAIPTSAISADESFLEQAHAKPRRGSRVWTAGCAAALLALAGQAAYFYRAEFAASHPALRTALAGICDALGCSVPLPQRPRLINIEASDLQIVDSARPGTIQLTATLRNHAGHDLGYPALDLVLTSAREHTLARRIFLPEEYMERPGDVKKGLAASAETTIRLTLDTGELGAAGFRLDLLPAPAR